MHGTTEDMHYTNRLSRAKSWQTPFAEQSTAALRLYSLEPNSQYPFSFWEKKFMLSSCEAATVGCKVLTVKTLEG